MLCAHDVQVLELQCKPAERYSIGFFIELTEVQQFIGPRHYSAISDRLGVAKRVFVGDGGQLSSRPKNKRGAQQPRTYCLVIPQEPLRYPLPPRICNVIMVPAEIRCSHAWPAGVSRSVLIEHSMPKLDSAASEHIVWSEKL